LAAFFTMHRHRIVIEPGTADLHYWRELWDHRGLLFFLAWRDVLVRYKQTAIGVLWGLLRPAITIGAMGFIGWLFGAEVPEGTPRVITVCAAVLPWQFFASSFGETANSLVANGNLLTKVYFPRLVLPFSTVLTSLIDFALALAVMAVLMIVYGFVPGIEALLLPFFLLLALVASFGPGLLIASLNVKYRDFRYLVPFIVQFGLYITPVAFSSAAVFGNPAIPEALKLLYACNPMVAVVDGFRWCLLGGTEPIHQTGFLISCGASLALLLIGIVRFRRTERGFADII
jgi:lipopolysaccharide transport system permease protein